MGVWPIQTARSCRARGQAYYFAAESFVHCFIKRVGVVFDERNSIFDRSVYIDTAALVVECDDATCNLM